MQTWSDIPTVAATGEMVNENGADRLLKTAIIDQESRRRLTPEEELAYGRSVGSVECQNKKTGKWSSMTAFVVSRNAIYTASHSLYEKAKDPSDKMRTVLTRTFDPVADCDFNLRNPVTGKTYKRILLEAMEDCANRSSRNLFEFKSCDFSVMKLMEEVPEDVPSLELLATTADNLEGLKVLAVGFHDGVVLNGTKVKSEVKLIDFGVVKPKGQRSELKGLSDKFAYTADTNDRASGQPIITCFKGNNCFVIGSHTGEVINVPPATGAPFDEFKHFNYATTIGRSVFDTLKRFSPREKARIELAETRVLK